MFYQIGDGGIVFSASGETESYRFAIEPAEALYVNMTDFITDETAAENVRFKFVEEEVEDLILFSDGIFPVAVDYQTNQPHEPFLDADDRAAQKRQPRRERLKRKTRRFSGFVRR